MTFFMVKVYDYICNIKNVKKKLKYKRESFKVVA